MGATPYAKQADGPALATVEAHAAPSDLVLYGSWFCPFVQRVWIALELKGLAYQYVEVDPYKKEGRLMEVNPRGLVPALTHGDWVCYESTVLMEYVDEIGGNKGALLPPNPKLRAHSRLWADHVNRHIIPSFYRLLQAQTSEQQTSGAAELSKHLSTLIDAADPEGPFFLKGNDPTLVDVMLTPWLLRFGTVLKHYRGWPDPEPGSRWEKWVKAIEKHDMVVRTTSSPELYEKSYERYAGAPPRRDKRGSERKGGQRTGRDGRRANGSEETSRLGITGFRNIGCECQSLNEGTR